MAFKLQSDSDAGKQPLQRLRIGGAGLVIVALLTGGVSTLVNRASNEVPVEDIVSEGSIETDPKQVAQEEENTEPLAELGVVPDLPATEEEQEASKEEATPQGQLVPDLKPKSDIANDPQ